MYDYTSPNMLAGSLLNLAPDTEYECRCVLTDPDGASGTTEHNVTVRSRKAPAPAAGGHTYHVYPVGFKGSMEQPAFHSLMGAYYMGSPTTVPTFTRSSVDPDGALAFIPVPRPGPQASLVCASESAFDKKNSTVLARFATATLPAGTSCLTMRSSSRPPP
jgi:hypothetical protein